MRAGGLDQKIQLLAFHAGSSSTNQRTKGTWEPVGVPIWAEVKCTKTQLSEQDGAMAYVTAYQFYIRRRSGITGNMRSAGRSALSSCLGRPSTGRMRKTD